MEEIHSRVEASSWEDLMSLNAHVIREYIREYKSGGNK
jgi:hypothetical protein